MQQYHGIKIKELYFLHFSGGAPLIRNTSLKLNATSTKTVLNAEQPWPNNMFKHQY